MISLDEIFSMPIAIIAPLCNNLVMRERFDLIVFEKFTYRGKVRHKAHEVGSASTGKDGYMLFIPSGVSISGRVMMVPEKTALTEIDLIEAYQSAADEHGL